MCHALGGPGGPGSPAVVMMESPAVCCCLAALDGRSGAQGTDLGGGEHVREAGGGVGDAVGQEDAAP